MNRARVAIFLALICAGCPKRIPPVDFGPGGPLTDPREVLARVDAAQARVITVTGDARLDVDSEQAKGGAGLFLSVSRPALLHLEPLDFFNRPQGVLVSDGQRFSLYSVPEDLVLTGPASPPNVSRLLPVVMPGEELTAVMLGEAPRLPTEDLTLTVDDKEQTYRLVLRHGAVEQTLWIHPQHFRVLKSEVRGAPAYDLLFDDFQIVGEVALPRRIVLASQAGKARLELRYKEVTVNGPLDLTYFEFEAPEGVKVVEVDESGRAVPASTPAPAQEDAPDAAPGDAPDAAPGGG